MPVEEKVKKPYSHRSNGKGPECATKIWRMEKNRRGKGPPLLSSKPRKTVAVAVKHEEGVDNVRPADGW